MSKVQLRLYVETDDEDYTKERITIIGGISKNGKIYTPRRDQIIREKDQFQIKSDPVDLKLMMDEYGLRLIKKMREGLCWHLLFICPFCSL